MKKAEIVCLRLKPGVAGWKAQTNPLSYGSTLKDESLLEKFYWIEPSATTSEVFLSFFNTLTTYMEPHSQISRAETCSHHSSFAAAEAATTTSTTTTIFEKQLPNNFWTNRSEQYFSISPSTPPLCQSESTMIRNVNEKMALCKATLSASSTYDVAYIRALWTLLNSLDYMDSSLGCKYSIHSMDSTRLYGLYNSIYSKDSMDSTRLYGLCRFDWLY